MKLLVLHNDSVAIWDAKECEIINELRLSKDLVSYQSFGFVLSEITNKFESRSLISRFLSHLTLSGQPQTGQSYSLQMAVLES